jgi:hypothetical protein
VEINLAGVTTISQPLFRCGRFAWYRRLPLFLVLQDPSVLYPYRPGSGQIYMALVRIPTPY